MTSPLLTPAQRMALVRKMTDAAIECLTDEEYKALTDWAEENLTCDPRFALQEGLKLAIAYDN